MQFLHQAAIPFVGRPEMGSWQERCTR
jgi:hypothetical protein